MVSVPKFVVLVMPVVGPVMVTPASVRFVDGALERDAGGAAAERAAVDR